MPTPSAQSGRPVPVTADNFVRAESDRFFAAVAVKEGALGRFVHHRKPIDPTTQHIIRANRDTLYSDAVFDLDAGPVTVTLPECGGRFRSMQVIDEDEYTHEVSYNAGPHVFSRERIGTRYVLVGIRALVDPNDPQDLAAVHALQDAIKVEQQGTGSFEIPPWDETSRAKVRQALLILAETVPETFHMFGMPGQVDPVRRLIGAASAWGGNPDSEATYLNVTPARNDGKTVHRLTVKDVPVDGFWSVTVYNAQGWLEPNPQNAWSLNSITAKKDAGGWTTIQFGGCDGRALNCLPITPGWNYLVRLYRPHPEILNGNWRFPEAQVVQ